MMEDITPVTVVSELNKDDPDPLNNAPNVIIRKENFGSEAYQQQQYQYNLLNNLRKREQYYEELAKTRDRYQKPVPTMQQVIHVDMKRVKINKIYERKLEQDVTGPRGLHWQHRQTLQRLKNTERDVARDLTRLKKEWGRVALSVYLNQSSPTSPESSPLSQRKTRSSSIDTKKMPVTQAKGTSNGKSNSSNDKHWYASKSTNFNMIEEDIVYYQQAQLIEQEKREVEQKLREFLL